MNHQRSQTALCKWLFQHSFHPSPKLLSLDSLSTSPTRRVSDSAPLPEPKILLNTPTTTPHHFLHPALSNSPTQFTALRNVRQFSGGSEEFDQNQVGGDRDGHGVQGNYFDEEAECARDSVKEVLELYEGLLAKVPESNKAALQRSMGLKIEQLKAELQQLNE
ncbi:hypothetical protein D8674_004420 [Pyrus ussuriensis x Pyrus communis]|uniref:Uncharacterized protein n=1 Tax=Pyrus ussuriensis x Pyrus communis TaxID=2448454 RepID=A0A5N5FJT7_9ROSA|nr:hypothetical protein D8674_004420 [Pyrus ussuriensis x Pyrus communis]